MRVAGTGHRPDKLGGYGEDVLARLGDLCVEALKQLQEIEPIEEVISGMALGFDTGLAIAAHRLHLPLVAAVPFEGQESRWRHDAQTLYHVLIKYAEQNGRIEVVCTDAGGFHPVKMQARNEWMVDRIRPSTNDVLLSLWNKTEGGTANCLRYAERQGSINIIDLWDDWIKVQPDAAMDCCADPKEIFVFGSNNKGRHGKGAAFHAAAAHGAISFQAKGRQGMSYGIPTRSTPTESLTLEEIANNVSEFLIYAKTYVLMNFYVTRIGCGLAGHQDEDIAFMFRKATPNCRLPIEWKAILAEHGDREYSFHK